MKNMRNLIAAMLVLLPFNIWAQDDVYFVPKKKAAKTERRMTSTESYSMPVEVVYSDGSSETFTTGSSHLKPFSSRDSFLSMPKSFSPSRSQQ